MDFQKQKQKIITHRKYKAFDKDKFRSDVLKYKFGKNDFGSYKDTLFNLFGKHVLLKRNMSVPMRLLLWQNSYIKKL